MIYAKHKDALAYRGIHPNLDLALEHITPEFLASVGSERVELKGGDVYAIRFTYTTVPAEESLGRVCGAPTVSCPPAVPVAVSGERIGAEALALFRYYGVKYVDVLKD